MNMENIETIRRYDVMNTNKSQLGKKLSERILPGYTESQVKGNGGMARIIDIFNNEFNWLITTIPNENDMGIDAYIEICINNKAQGMGFMIQNKTGTSHLEIDNRGKKFFCFDEKKYNYWSSHKLPVILIFVENLKDRASLPLWVYFDNDKVFRRKQKFGIEVYETLSKNSTEKLISLAFQPNKFIRFIEKLHEFNDVYHDLNKANVFAELENVVLKSGNLIIGFVIKDQFDQSLSNHVILKDNCDIERNDYSDIDIILDIVKEKLPGLNILFGKPEFLECLASYNDDNPGGFYDADENAENEREIEPSSQGKESSYSPALDFKEFAFEEDIYFTLNNIGIEYLKVKDSSIISEFLKKLK